MCSGCRLIAPRQLLVSPLNYHAYHTNTQETCGLRRLEETLVQRMGPNDSDHKTVLQGKLSGNRKWLVSQVVCAPKPQPEVDRVLDA
jgi:hypothetical protein